MNSSPTQRREDKGFTLIELMVVVLIIAILLAIAIPTFLGAQNKAKDRSAQSSARNALTNAKTIYADGGVYYDAVDLPLAAMVAKLTLAEPSLTFVVAPAPSLDAKTVSVLTVDKDTWYAAVFSDTNTCFYVMDSVATGGGGTSYGKAENSTSAKCMAVATLTPITTGVVAADLTDWTAKW